MFDRYPERVDTPNGAPDAGATGADKTVLSGPFARLRKASDRVPTKWFATIGTTLFVVVTAAFGGLNAVAAVDEPVPTIATGVVHESAQLNITVQRAVLIDSLRGAGAFPDRDKGERLLVLLVEIENRWHAPASGSMFAGLLEPTYHRNVVIDGMGTVADGIVREDDQTLNPTLQPRVPAVLAFSWVVPADAYRDGQTLTVLLKDAELLEGQMLFHGEYWSAPEPAARAQVTIEDVGAGASQ